jgi:hypothetical protein
LLPLQNKYSTCLNEIIPTANVKGSSLWNLFIST